MTSRSALDARICNCRHPERGRAWPRRMRQDESRGRARFRCGHFEATRLGEGRNGTHRLHPRRDRTQVLDQPRPRDRRVAGCQDQSDRHSGVSRLHGRRPRGHLGGRRRRPRARRDVGGGGRHREVVGVLRSARVASHPVRFHDGQGARRLRESVPGDQGGADSQGHSGRDPGRRRTGIQGHHQSLLPKGPPVQAGYEDGRVRRDRRSVRVSGTARGLLTGADRDHRHD